MLHILRDEWLITKVAKPRAALGTRVSQVLVKAYTGCPAWPFPTTDASGTSLLWPDDITPLMLAVGVASPDLRCETLVEPCDPIGGRGDYTVEGVSRHLPEDIKYVTVIDYVPSDVHLCHL